MCDATFLLYVLWECHFLRVLWPHQHLFVHAQTVSVLTGCLCLKIALFQVTEQLLQVFQVLQEMFLLCIYLLFWIALLLNGIYHLPE